MSLASLALATRVGKRSPKLWEIALPFYFSLKFLLDKSKRV